MMLTHHHEGSGLRSFSRVEPSNTTRLREAVKNGFVGLLFPYRDSALADLLSRSCASAERREHLIMRGAPPKRGPSATFRRAYY